ncbi:3502_t:CDS:10 [Ambispora leptoticha]|uniref:3502_t:CDS:1 n=1 Tax=Ambispora leptoticha TaxID=144679 RepID=A0A9N8WEP9_9GLOM|nr:3502_t:CDS:10 [Ambispora leptoticha]
MAFPRHSLKLNKSKKKGQECHYCGLTARFPDGAGGFVCPLGHRDERLILQVNEDYDPCRPNRSQKRKKIRKNQEVKAATAYYGDKKTYVYIVSLQHVLRHQIRVMIEDINCPPEYEHIIRHLWILLFNDLPDIRFPPEWLDENGRIRNKYEKDKEDNKDDIAAYDNKHENLENLLIMQERESSDESEGSNNDDRNYDMNVNLAILYLGCVWLRQPILLTDIIKWANNDRIPYYTARTLLPDSLRRRIERYNKSFEPIKMHPMYHFEKIVNKLTSTYYSSYGILFPEINMPPMLYRYIREFLLPVEFYPIAKELGNLVGLDLSSSAYLRRHYVNPAPKLLSLLVVIAKLMYGLDGQKRIPTEKDQFVKYFPSKEKWLAALQERFAHKNKHDLPIDLRQWHEYSETYPDEYIKFAEKQLFRPFEEKNHLSNEDLFGEYHEDYKNLLRYAAEELLMQIGEFSGIVNELERDLYERARKNFFLKC